jgi:hypothetical protein
VCLGKNDVRDRSKRHGFKTLRELQRSAAYRGQTLVMRRLRG